LQDRLAAIIYGFTAGETNVGFKKGRLFTVGSGNPAASIADTVDLFAKTINGKVELCAIDPDGNVTQLTEQGALRGQTGDIKMTGCLTAPTGWLLCNGDAVSRTTYANLFAALGTRYGVGNGTTTFNIPSFNGRVPRGVIANPGVGGGNDTVSGNTDAHVLTAAEIPVHHHTYADVRGAGGTYGGGSIIQPPGTPTTTDTSDTGGGGGHTHPFTGVDIVPTNTQALFIIHI
jgi:hypothetical protein